MSEVHVKRFKSKEVGSKKLQEAFLFSCADGSLRQGCHAQRQTLRHQRVERLDAGGVPSSLGEARRDTLQGARRDPSQEDGGVADASEADRDPMEAREDVWSMSAEFFLSPPCHASENNCMYRKSHHSQFRQNTLTSWGKQKLVWTIGQGPVLLMYGTLVEMKFPLKVGADPRFRK